MNPSECVQVLDQLKTTFPDWRNWVNQLPEKQATLRLWCEALTPHDIALVSAIIGDWASGRVKCPETYERERLIYLLTFEARTRSRAISERLKSKQALESYEELAAEAKRRRNSYRSLMDHGGGWTMARFRDIADQIVAETGLPRSRWTAAEHERYGAEVKLVIAQFCKMQGYSHE
jgi:hypothetical protein